MPNSGPIPSRARVRVVTTTCSLALAAFAAPLLAQRSAAAVPWRFSAEAGAAGGGVWLEGPNVPRVSTGIGFTFAAGARRALNDAAEGAAVLRVSMQPLDLDENGAQWNGGTLTQYDLMAILAVRAPSPASLRATLEGGIGAAVLTGASAIVPFRDAGSVAPMGEVGVAVMLGSASATRNVSLVARYGVVRANAAADEGATGGWVARVSAGARITR
jgi:hypothetical protein